MCRSALSPFVQQWGGACGFTDHICSTQPTLCTNTTGFMWNKFDPFAFFEFFYSKQWPWLQFCCGKLVGHAVSKHSLILEGQSINTLGSKVDNVFEWPRARLFAAIFLFGNDFLCRVLSECVCRQLSCINVSSSRRALYWPCAATGLHLSHPGGVLSTRRTHICPQVGIKLTNVIDL